MTTPDATLAAVASAPDDTVPGVVPVAVLAPITAPVPAPQRGTVLDSPSAAVPGPKAAPVLHDTPAVLGSRGTATADRTETGTRTTAPEATSTMAVNRPIEQRSLTKLQIFAFVIVGAAAIALAVYGAATSYVSIRTLAFVHHVPFPRLNPIGIDGGLLTVVAFDIVLTWVGIELLVLRWLARLFALATIGTNAMSGWPDPTAVALHITPSVLLVIIIEGVRAALLLGHESKKDKKDKKRPAQREQDDVEPIPFMRWVVDPFGTFIIARRMILWRVPSYKVAIELELDRRRAKVRLKSHFGPDWKEKADDDLLWMLRKGVRIPEACARVDLLVRPKQDSTSGPNPTVRPNPRSSERGRGRQARGRGRAAGTAPLASGPAPQNGAGTGAQNGAGTATQNGAGTATQNGAGTATQNGGGTGVRKGLAAVPRSGPTDADDPTADLKLMAHGRQTFTAFRTNEGRSPTLDEFTPLLGRARTVASKVRNALLEELDEQAKAVAR